MGVHRLTGFIEGRKEEEGVKRKEVHLGRSQKTQQVLIVDGVNFLMEFWDKFLWLMSGGTFKKVKHSQVLADAIAKRQFVYSVMGVDCFSLDFLLNELLDAFKQFGIRLVVIMDNSVDVDVVEKALELPKGAQLLPSLVEVANLMATRNLCVEGRKQQKVEQVAALMAFLANELPEDRYPDEATRNTYRRTSKKIPAGGFWEMQQILARRPDEEVVLFYGTNEADSLLAEEAFHLTCVKAPAAGIPTAVFSGDSDFSIIEGLSYVPMRRGITFPYVSTFGHYHDKRFVPQCKVTVLSSAEVAKRLGLPLSALPGFATLLGMDYTREVMKAAGVWNLEEARQEVKALGLTQPLAAAVGITPALKYGWPTPQSMADWLRRTVPQKDLEHFDPLQLPAVAKLIELMDELPPIDVDGTARRLGELFAQGIRYALDTHPRPPRQGDDGPRLTLYNSQLQWLAALEAVGHHMPMQLAALEYRGVLSSSMLDLAMGSTQMLSTWWDEKPAVGYHEAMRVEEYRLWWDRYISLGPSSAARNAVRKRIVEAIDRDFFHDSKGDFSGDVDVRSDVLMQHRTFHAYGVTTLAPIYAVFQALLGVKHSPVIVEVPVLQEKPSNEDEEDSKNVGKDKAQSGGGDRSSDLPVVEPDMPKEESKGDEPSTNDTKAATPWLCDAVVFEPHPCFRPIDLGRLVADAGLAEVMEDVVAQAKQLQGDGQEATELKESEDHHSQQSPDTATAALATARSAVMVPPTATAFHHWLWCASASELMWDRAWSVHAPFWAVPATDDPGFDWKPYPRSQFMHIHNDQAAGIREATHFLRRVNVLAVKALGEHSFSEVAFDRSGLALGLLALRYMLCTRMGQLADAASFLNGSSSINVTSENYDYRLTPLMPEQDQFLSLKDLDRYIWMLVLLHCMPAEVRNLRSHAHPPTVAMSTTMAVYKRVCDQLKALGILVGHYPVKSTWDRTSIKAIPLQQQPGPEMRTWMDGPLLASLYQLSGFKPLKTAFHLSAVEDEALNTLVQKIKNSMLRSLVQSNNGCWLLAELSRGAPVPPSDHLHRLIQALFRPEPFSREKKLNPFVCDPSFESKILRAGYEAKTAGKAIAEQQSCR